MALDIYRRRKDKIDAVLLDIGFPKQAGRDVLLKMKEENSDIKLVVTSGYLEPELNPTSIRPGFIILLPFAFPLGLLGLFPSCSRLPTRTGVNLERMSRKNGNYCGSIIS